MTFSAYSALSRSCFAWFFEATGGVCERPCLEQNRGECERSAHFRFEVVMAGEGRRVLNTVLISCILLCHVLDITAKPGSTLKQSFLDRLHKFTSHFKEECDACKAFTEIAHIAFKTKPNENEIAAFLTKICIKMKIEDKRVCDGIIKEFQEEVLTVFDDYFVSSNEICGSLFGTSCAKKPDPDVFWNVTFPKTPKPPVRPIPAPKVKLVFQ